MPFGRCDSQLKEQLYTSCEWIEFIKQNNITKCAPYESLLHVSHRCIYLFKSTVNVLHAYIVRNILIHKLYTTMDGLVTIQWLLKIKIKHDSLPLNAKIL